MNSINPVAQGDVDPCERSLAYLPALDGLRGLAILTVVFHHLLVIPNKSDDSISNLFRQLAVHGWVGVDLFFVLSGFLITSILIKYIGKPHWLRNFYARRALRVLPLYYLVIFVGLCVFPLIPYAAFDWLRDLSSWQAWYWLHGANFVKIMSQDDPTMPSVGWFSTFWSLSIEEQFYVFWPLVVWLSGRNLFRVCVVGSLLVFAARSIAGGLGENSLAYNHTLLRLDGLLLGSAAGFLHCTKGLSQYRLPAITLSISCFAIFAFTFVAYSPVISRTNLYGAAVLHTASTWGSLGLVVWLLQLGPRDLIWRGLTSSAIRFTGTISFGMYVLNKPVIAGIASLVSYLHGPLEGIPLVFVLVLTTGCVMLAGTLSWYLIEKPMLKLKVYFPLVAKNQASVPELVLKKGG